MVWFAGVFKIWNDDCSTLQIKSNKIFKLFLIPFLFWTLINREFLFDHRNYIDISH